MLLFRVWWHKKQDQPDLIRISSDLESDALENLAAGIERVLIDNSYSAVYTGSMDVDADC